ncbi:MAG: hypothetical protein R6W73_02955 [Candidatus Saliniplasma sp.]
MSPPMNPNGGGSDDTCPYGVYLTYDECLQYHGGDEEYCSCVCISSYSGCDDDLPNPPAGSECDSIQMEVGGVPYGLKISCNIIISSSYNHIVPSVFCGNCAAFSTPIS